MSLFTFLAASLMPWILGMALLLAGSSNVTAQAESATFSHVDFYPTLLNRERVAESAQSTAISPTTVLSSTTPASRDVSVHIVQAGESLVAIAARYNVTVDSMAAANRLSDPNLLQIGQQLVVPSGLPRPPLSSLPTAPLSDPRSTVDVAMLHFVCTDNATVLPLDLPADPIRIIAVQDTLYLLADGQLYRLSNAEARLVESPSPQLVMPPDNQVATYKIRELVYATVDPASQDLLLLDKTNDIYRYTATGEWQMAFPAEQIPGQFPDPQFIAIQVVGGNLYALDSDLTRVWLLSPGARLSVTYLSNDALLSGVDMVMPTASEFGDMVVLTREASVLQLNRGAGVTPLAQNGSRTGVPWPSQLLETDAGIAVVDGEERSVTEYDLATGEIIRQIEFRFPNMQRLRSVVIGDDIIFGIAGRTFYIGALSDPAACPPVLFDDTLYFDGLDIATLMLDFQLPFPNAHLPMRPRSYPGARRLYRYGIHKGLDLYSTEAAGLGAGSPIQAIAEGVVVRSDGDFVEMSPLGYEVVMAEAALDRGTTPESTDKLLGRQLHLDHGSGVQSWYAHLSAVGDGLAPGASLQRGQIVGRVGLSGTSSGVYRSPGNAHLHFEIWINGRYLGQGLSIYETMRLWQAILGSG